MNSLAARKTELEAEIKHVEHVLGALRHHIQEANRVMAALRNELITVQLALDGNFPPDVALALCKR